jgi:hypothetical protein
MLLLSSAFEALSGDTHPFKLFVAGCRLRGREICGEPCVYMWQYAVSGLMPWQLPSLPWLYEEQMLPYRRP